MNLPQLSTATAAEIIDHERHRSMDHEPDDRADRYQYLSTRLAIVIEKLVDQRDSKPQHSL